MKTFMAVALTFLLFSCKEVKLRTKRTDQTIYIPSASIPYFTKTNQNEIVVCWVRKGVTEGENVLCYAKWNGFEDKLDSTIYIPVTSGVQENFECPPKIAFKSNGNVLAMYTVRRPTLQNKYAAQICYTQSFDKGQTWTPAQFLVKNKAPESRQRFFDVQRMRNGELAVIWLDIRRNESENETSLLFASTTGARGFANEKLIAEKVCECCRTKLLADSAGNLHVLFRDIIHDSVRDIVYMQSGNNGLIFSVPQRISRDNWDIDGCPHTGPDMTCSGGEVSFVWFTGGGGAGVYSCVLGRNKLFSARKLLSSYGRFPQITSQNKNRYIVYEECSSNFSAWNSVLFLQEQSLPDRNRIQITPDTLNSIYPVITSGDNGELFIAWTEKNTATTKVVLRKFVHPPLPQEKRELALTAW